MKRQSIFGVIYGAIWFSVFAIIFTYELDFPLSEWLREGHETGKYSLDTVLLGIRVMWAVEYILHVLLAAIPTAILIYKYYPTATHSDLLKISTVCIVLMSIFIYVITPRFVPFYIAITVQVSSYFICLFGSYSVTKYITRRLNGKITVG